MTMALGEATSLADRKRRAGQRLFVGFDGLTADDDLRKRVALMQPAGFLLFGHNVAEVDQVIDLGQELGSLVDGHRPPILGIDQEGGRVQRLRDLGVEWPPMATVGRVPRLAEDVALAMARQLRALGLHLNFAPVAEPLADDASPIGDRAFGSDPAAVAELTRIFVEAQQAEGVMACAKHFPGHGASTVDSHQALPVRTGTRWRDAALRPFEAAVAGDVAVIMTAHVALPDVDPEQPVTFSERVVPRWLRRDLGYDGLVCTDDLVMAAVRDRLSFAEQVDRITLASIDLLVVGKEPERQVALFEALVRGQERNPGFEAACVRAEARLQVLRERFWVPKRRPVDRSVLTEPANRALVEAIRKDDPLA